MSAKILLIITLLVLCITQKAQGGDEVAKALMGRWKIVGVRLDETLMRRPNYNYNDPELMGRYIAISPRQIKTTMPEETGCSQPAFSVEQRSLEDLINATMGRATYSEGQSNRFALPVDTAKEVKVIWVRCKEGNIGPDTPSGPADQNWVVPLAKGQVAMRWYDNTILLLKRVK